MNKIWENVSYIMCTYIAFMCAKISWDVEDQVFGKIKLQCLPVCHGIRIKLLIKLLIENKANLRDLIAATCLVITNWIQIVNFSARVTVKFDGWPCKTIGHLFYATSSFLHHFVAIGEFKLELQSGNAQSGSNLTIFRAVRPWNLTDDLAKQ